MALDNLEVKFNLTATWTIAKAVPGLDSQQHQGSLGKPLTFTTGTSASLATANQWYSAVISIAGGGTLSLDLAGTLANVLSRTGITFARVRGLFVRLLAVGDVKGTLAGTACSGVTVGVTPTSTFVGPASGTHQVKNGGTYVWCDPSGYPVTAGSTDLLVIGNNDAALAAVLEVGILGPAS